MTRSSTVGLVVEALLIILALVSIIGGNSDLAAYCSAAWVLLALTYVTSLVWAAWRRRVLPEDLEIREPALKLHPRLVSLLGSAPVIAALMGLINVLVGANIPQELVDQLSSVHSAEETESLIRIIQVVFTVMTILMAVLGWALLHLGYARHYERLDHLYGPALQFPGTADPDLTDYVYFSLTVGTTFATSDVAVTSRRLRWTVAVHSVFAFFYNAIVLVVAFKFITG
ncbi:DUF1345 domain-containing protein [Actinomyces sp. Z5]|uniref:DUF1345 domain-containing protein n=1 Tax=Actinomyces sp. Z5 TaxID=2250216 RepID=UPI000DCC3C9A|nr:DUF1345 domain-containing protein [Actinomyces sp. Z5]RAX22444.1 DUF1345 domain-containing protein [Actinomyces sp. Z5]